MERCLVPMAGPPGTRQSITINSGHRAEDKSMTAKIKNQHPYGQVGEIILMEVTFM